MTGPTVRVSLRCDLNGLVAQRFQELKATLGLKTNAELVRLAVMVMHLQIQAYRTHHA
jgi:hypothetical protein